MIRKFILPILAVIGVGLAAGAISNGSKPFIPPAAAFQAAQSPYPSFIAGAGLTEATTGNISIGTPVSGIITDIYVQVGDHVEKGDPLFKIDDRALQAALLPATTNIDQAQAALDKAKADLAIAEKIKDKAAISAEQLSERRADVEIGEAALDTAQAQVAQIKLTLERHTVRAPVAGQILQVKTHLGEFADAGAAPVPLMIMGGDTLMNVRVDIDEYDAWRFKKGAKATAYLRGDPSVSIPLTYVRTEPYVTPKKSLTGNSTERTDTRVLQVLYSFDPDKTVPLYIGQLLDVFIDAPAQKESH